jgi:hypothetical protein
VRTCRESVPREKATASFSPETMSDATRDRRALVTTRGYPIHILRQPCWLGASRVRLLTRPGGCRFESHLRSQIAVPILYSTGTANSTYELVVSHVVPFSTACRGFRATRRFLPIDHWRNCGPTHRREYSFADALPSRPEWSAA